MDQTRGHGLRTHLEAPGKVRQFVVTGRIEGAFRDRSPDLIGGHEKRLTGQGVKPFFICLQGPPGTGKSAYARYLAERMGMEVLHKRTSDLIDTWVGASEQNIAEAFREALDTGLFRAYFDMEAPAALWSLTVLTPGDFPVVRRKAEVTGQLSDAEALVAMLKAECDVKPNRPSGMGFRTVA